MEKKTEKGIKVLLCILIALVALGFCIRIYNHIWARQYAIDMFAPHLKILRDQSLKQMKEDFGIEDDEYVIYDDPEDVPLNNK